MPKAIKATTAKATKATTAPAPAKAQADAPKTTHAHRDAGLPENRYTGLSGYLNANRKTAIKLANYPRTVAQLTPRTLAFFGAVRDTYGSKPFNARGADNAIIAMLTTAGLIERIDGTGADTRDANGVATIADGPNNPAQFRVTATGAKHGKA